MLTLNFKSFPNIETERLILREHSIADAATLFALRTNEDVMLYIDREKPKTVEDSEIAITNVAEGVKQDRNLIWVIALKENPAQMIGEIGYYRANLLITEQKLVICYIPVFGEKE